MTHLQAVVLSEALVVVINMHLYFYVGKNSGGNWGKEYYLSYRKLTLPVRSFMSTQLAFTTRL